MKKSQFWNQLIFFTISLFIILGIRTYFSHLLLENQINTYTIHTAKSIGANLVLITLSYFLIKRNKLELVAGMASSTLNKGYLLIFPLMYLVILNLLIMDDVILDDILPHIILLFIYSISIGLAEELSIRGFLQSFLIKHLGDSKRNVVYSVFVSSVFFGLLHLINFDKGIYGEVSQIFFATFIGAMFGFLLLITNRIYPLIIIHSIIDFVAKLDSTGLPITEKISQSMSIENSIIIALLALPCLLYAIFLMKKHLTIRDLQVYKEGLMK